MQPPVAFYKSGDEVQGLRILEELGQGAASTVYLAQDPKTKQIWALKHVHRSTEKDERFLEQAILEQEIAGKFDHPNLRKIPKLYKERPKLLSLTISDVYLVMEFTDGVSMEKSRPKTYEDAIDIFLQTAQAMQHMHQRGYVHADMKPNNIMVQPGPVVKIIDLGQSCKIGTVKPRIQGTPDYIAPEQVMRKPITPITDIYNLGATMYWTITQKTVPTSLNQANENSLVDKIDPSLLPRPQPVTELAPRCPQKLSELIMECCEIDPDDRPQNMGGVIDRLQLILGIVRARRSAPAGAGDSAGPLMLDSSATKTGAPVSASSNGSRSSSRGG